MVFIDSDADSRQTNQPSLTGLQSLASRIPAVPAGLLSGALAGLVDANLAATSSPGSHSILHNTLTTPEPVILSEPEQPRGRVKDPGDGWTMDTTSRHSHYGASRTLVHVILTKLQGPDHSIKLIEVGLE